MDPLNASSQLPIATPSKKTLAFSSSTPVKGQSSLPSDDPFWTPTPEKPAQSRRACGRSIAFSVNEVRQPAVGFHKKVRGTDQRLDRALVVVEKQLRSDKAEDELPHPFNASCKLLSTPKIIKKRSTIDEPQSIVLSHFPATFQRRFSQKATIYAQRNSFLNPFPTNSPNRCTSPSEATPVKKCVSSSKATPAKLVSIPTRLMAPTPGMKTPKRCLSESSVDLPPAKRSESKGSARSLLFTSSNKSIKGKRKQGEKELVETCGEDGVLDFLPKSLLQSVKEKEIKVLLEKEAGVADTIRRQRMMRCLPTTFNTVLLAYRSMNRSVMTKQELIHKIIVNNLKVVDRDEIQEQLRLLQEILPDWICEKALGGDVLLQVNMLCCPEEIRERLAKAE